MDKFFKVIVQNGESTKVLFVSHVYDVECLVDNLRFGESLHVDVLYVTDVTRETADSVLHDVKD